MHSPRFQHWLGLAILVAAFAASGCAGKGPKFDIRAPAPLGTNGLAFTELASTNTIPPEWLKAPTDFYRIGPGDVLDFDIQGDKAERVTALVGPDGKVYISLLPAVFVWGKTLSEAETLIQNEFGRYVRTKPEVAVTLRGANSERFWTMGSVANPGVYSLATPTTLLEAIAKANGLQQVTGTTEPSVDLKNSFVLRKGERVPVDFDRLFNYGDLSQNIYLAPDDYVYIKSATARQVYVLGAVARATVIPYGANLSLLSAISAAGGTQEYAYLGHVAVVRGSLNSPKIAIVDLKSIQLGKVTDVPLEPGDLVFVPFAPYRKLAQFAERVLGTFVNTVAVNEGRRAVIRGADPTGISLPGGLGGGGFTPIIAR